MPGGAPHPKSAVIANCASLLAAARAAGAQPVLVHVGGSPDGADRAATPTDQQMRSTGPLPPDWSELIPELDRQPGDIVILKRQWGAFYGTDLDLQLRRRGLTTIVLCGIATEFGVESTARDAYERGYELIFAEDAMTGTSAESHSTAWSASFPASAVSVRPPRFSRPSMPEILQAADHLKNTPLRCCILPQRAIRCVKRYHACLWPHFAHSRARPSGPPTPGEHE